MIGQFRLQRSLQDCFRELFQEAVLADDVFRFLVIGQQLFYQCLVDRHCFRFSSSDVRLHSSFYTLSASEPSCDRLSSNSASACTIPCPKPDSGSSRSYKATSTTTRYRETSRDWACSGIGCLRSGGVPFAVGARNTGSRGRAFLFWLSDGFLNRERSIPFPTLALSPIIRDKN